MSTLSLILRQVVNGLQSGSIYALVALGYSMVYGIIMLLNFAHGDIIMVGAYAAWFCLCGFAGNPILAIIAAIFVCVLLGVSIEKVAYAPLLNVGDQVCVYFRDGYVTENWIDATDVTLSDGSAQSAPPTDTAESEPGEENSDLADGQDTVSPQP